MLQFKLKMTSSTKTATKFDADDNELSNFAKTLALPVRVAIVRIIIKHGNNTPKEKLLNLPVNQATINKHISELRTLKIIKQYGLKDALFYSIEQDIFTKMNAMFSMLFTNIGDMRAKKEGEPKTDTKNDVKKAFPNFGAYIQHHRMELNMTQDVFSKKTGIDRADVSRIERGRKLLEANKLKLLSKVLYIDLPTLKQEYYSYKIAELADESGLRDTILDSAKEKFNQLKP